MHRGHFGGNARKRKTRLTDATFNAVIGAAALADPALETPEGDTVDVALVESELRVVSMSVLRAGTALSMPRSREFRAQEYHFGYASCPNCHNDQAYYLHQSLLADGYTFRCRICRLELTITANE